MRNATEDAFKCAVIHTPFPGVGVVVKRYHDLGDFVLTNSSLLSMYNPDLDH